MFNLSVVICLILYSFASAQRNPQQKCDYTFVTESAICSRSNSLREIASEFRPGWKHVKITPYHRGGTFSTADADSSSLDFITHLDLGDIGSIFISDVGFRQFTSLTSLTLSNASITMIENWFSRQNVLVDLNLSKNGITALQRTQFRKFGRLQWLNLERNSIESYEESVFQDVFQLEYLNLRNNQIQFIGSFGNLNRLQNLDLAGNLIRDIPTNAFGHLGSLHLLQLEQNSIANIQEGAFNGLNNLRELNLSGNSLRQLAPNMFSLNRLKILDLCNNGIEQILENTFRDLRHLIHLNLSQNALTELDTTTFSGLSSLHLLLLNNNKILNIQPNTFGNFQSIVHLGLSGNMLQTLSGDMFGQKPLTTLQKLFIQSNRIENVQPRTFEFTPYVDFLSLAHNQLSTFDENLFAPLTNLRKLHLQNNQLTEVPKKFLDDINKLYELQIRHNRLSFLPGTESKYPNLQVLKIEGNPWQCACLKELLDFITARHIDYAPENNPFYTGMRPICYEPPVNPAPPCVRDINLVREHRVVENYFDALNPRRG